MIINRKWLDMIRLRPATTTDADWLYVLHRAAMHDLVATIWGWNENVQRRFFQDHLASGDHSIIETEDIAIGALQVLRSDDHIHLGSIEILPAYQGRGIGSSIIQSLIDEAHAAGVPVRLQVLKINPSAKKLYERLGFRIDGQTETHLLMTTTPPTQI